ncbi:MAG: RHS repeat-associated core domain-containing protein, partial [Clostridiales bacterium]|nr:RHS repeat-associated core domain-containing protein [Clostridiales bacterium]
LYYLRARYMDPSSGTFTSMDTYAGSLSDPMSLHKYLFANSNPVKYCDPSGHKTLIEQGLKIRIVE